MKLQRILLILLTIDGIFIVLHILHLFTSLLPDASFSLLEDWGYAEIYGYVKWSLLAITLFILSRKYILFIGWAFVFLYLLLDDSFSIHERAGYHISAFIGPTGLDMKVQDVGELVYFALFGIFLLSWIVLSYRYGNYRFKKFSMVLFVLFGMLGFVGVVIDAGRGKLSNYPMLDAVLGILEDGGELIVITLMVVYVYYFKIKSTLAVPINPDLK